MAAGRVANKIALVTGAAAGLGRAIALRLSEEGASLVLADIAEHPAFLEDSFRIVEYLQRAEIR